jgi:hypothetical protein
MRKKGIEKTKKWKIVFCIYFFQTILLRRTKKSLLFYFRSK